MTSSPSRPRSMVTIAGVSLSYRPVSQINAISAVRSTAFSLRNGTRDGDPDSSSPSNKNKMFAGTSPVTDFQARHASMNVINWPLSSQAPRAADDAAPGAGLDFRMKRRVIP